MNFVAERSTDAGRHFIVRDDQGEHVTGLSFRYVCALAAAEAGHVHAVRRRRSYYGMTDTWMEADTGLYGIAGGTLWTLSFHGLLESPREAEHGAILRPTKKGAAVLAAIREAGCDTLLTERLAA